MQLGYSKEQELFRQQVRQLLADPPVRDGIAALRADPDPEPDARPLYRELGRRGLLAVNWPECYGGGGRGLLDAAVAVEEMVRAGVPDTLHVNTIQIVGLFLLMAGTPQQQARYLPGLASGERFASVLYTEPEAGSDLGSLTTTAVPDPDGGWLLSGLKMFSLKGHLTDFGLCAARTGPPESRYQGITLFLVDLHAPGVRRSIVSSIADEQFARVELDDVRVPADDRLGEVNNGWPLVTQALTVERTGLDYCLKSERWLAAACDVLVATNGPQGVDGAVLEEVGRYGAAVDAGRLLAWQVLAGLADGEVDELAAATAKFYTSELAQRIAGWATARLAGSAGDPRLPAEAVCLLEAAFREAPGLTISAGTSEMMLQIIASLALDQIDGSGASPATLHPDPVGERLRTVVRGRLRDAVACRAAAGPRAFEQVDESTGVAWSVLRGLGMPAMDAPVEAGGLALGLTASGAVAEELGRAGLSVPYLAGAFATDAAAGTGDIGQPLLRDLADGRRTVALAGFELPVPAAHATMDAEGTLSLTGRLPMDRPDGELAEMVLLPVALPDDHAGLVLLDRAAIDLQPGLDPSGAGVGVLDDVRCSGERLLTSRRRSEDCPGGAFGRARIRQAAYLLGLAQGALEAGVRHAGERRQFGRTLRDFQSVAFRLSAACVEVEALRLTVTHAIWLADGDEPFGQSAAEALAQAAETATAVTRTVVQVCGVRGMTSHLPVQRYYVLGRREASRLGRPGQLWQEAARQRLADR